MTLRLELCAERVEHVQASALLVPVDGAICRLGGAPANALRAALSADERDVELEYVEHELARIRPLRHPEARVIEGIARWTHLVVSAAYPHNVNDASFSPADCARMIRAALPVAIAAASAAGVTTLSATVIGTAYRMPADMAVRAFVDGLSGARDIDMSILWSLPDTEHLALARDAARRVGLA